MRINWKPNGAEVQEFCRSFECSGKLTIHIVYADGPFRALECSECGKFSVR
jgi:hypothetical protein